MRGHTAKRLRRIANKVGAGSGTVYEGERLYEFRPTGIRAVGTYGFYKYLKRGYKWAKRRSKDEPRQP